MPMPVEKTNDNDDDDEDDGDDGGDDEDYEVSMLYTKNKSKTAIMKTCNVSAKTYCLTHVSLASHSVMVMSFS